jgi:hypothetical protein
MAVNDAEVAPDPKAKLGDDAREPLRYRDLADQAAIAQSALTGGTIGRR